MKNPYKVIGTRRRLDASLNKMHRVDHAKVIHYLTEGRRARLAMVSEGARWRMESILVKEVVRLQN